MDIIRRMFQFKCENLINASWSCCLRIQVSENELQTFLHKKQENIRLKWSCKLLDHPVQSYGSHYRLIHDMQSQFLSISHASGIL
jgi:hypothetical protein